MNHIVLGMNFGDEGKGSKVHDLANSNSLVIRFSGGHQAGHTVVDTTESTNRRHVFSHFGAGTFKGAPTFWSRFCTYYPTGMLRERAKIVELGVTPTIYIDPLSPVATPYDVIYNQTIELHRGDGRHGSVGVGVGHTFERHDTTPLKLFAKDLYCKDAYKEKLKVICEYYRKKAVAEGFGTEYDQRARDPRVISVFTDAVDMSMDVIILHDASILYDYQRRIFEGSQGILLDQDHGICFPHVTRAYTTCRNAIELIPEQHPAIELHHMTRCYLTRHGRGPLRGEQSSEDMLSQYFSSLTDETNVPNPYQETLRYAILNKSYFEHSIRANAHELNRSLAQAQKDSTIRNSLCVTCTDQLKQENEIPCSFDDDGNDIRMLSTEGLANIANDLSDVSMVQFGSSAFFGLKRTRCTITQ